MLSQGRANTSSARSRKGFGGLVVRREGWHLTWRGWLLIASVAVVFGWILLAGAHRFLALSAPVNADALVIEGWLGSYAIRAATEEFQKGPYRRLYTTGGPVSGTGGYTNDYNTYASVSAEVVKAAAPEIPVQMVPCRVHRRDRTYASAVALKEWLLAHEPQVRAVNVATEDAHGRRTRLLFQKALGPDIKVGVIPLRNPDYDPDRWWQYSEGVREVIGESLAYIYVKLFFSPE